MDKSYILHNLKIYDSANDDGKCSLDIELTFKNNDPDEPIADVKLIKKTINVLSPADYEQSVDSTTYNDVNLTGGSGGNLIIAKLKIINNTSETKSFTKDFPSIGYSGGLTTRNYMSAPNSDVTLEIPVIGETETQIIMAGTSSNGGSVTGNARIQPGPTSSLYISGDATLTFN